METATFGRWTVIQKGVKHHLCRCSCGTEKLVNAYTLRRGLSASCGCAKREVAFPGMKVLTAEVLRQLLDYEKDTGEFTWKSPLANRVRPGDKAGQRDGHGYRQITICNRAHLAHRLAWLYTYGEWPDGQIDHKNRDRSDNRISNLRLASNTQNRANSGLGKNNKSGVKGVHWYPTYNKWVAVIRVAKKSRFLGYFEDKEAAAEAYRRAAVECFGDFASF